MSPGADTVGVRGPYPGLRPFEREEDDLFFGREEQVDQLLDKLDETHFLAVLGTSGSGKSSLVRAGLLPALESGFMAGAGARWDIAELRPGDQPLRRLAAALIENIGWGSTYPTSAVADAAPQRPDTHPTPPDPSRGEGAAPITDLVGGAPPRRPDTAATADSPHRGGGAASTMDAAIAALEQDLRSGSMALNWRLGVQPLAEGTRLLVLVDQFEELFRYHLTNSREAADFVALLLAAATHPDVYLVITLRSESLGQCSLYPGLPEAINRGLFLTPSLTPEQMADAIQLPAELPQFGGSVDPELVRQLLKEARGQTDQLPLLQHTLMRLWDLDEGDKHLTVAKLKALGGLRQALDAHVEETFSELREEQQRIAEVLFRSLTERGSAESDTRRPVPLREIAELAGVGWTQVVEVVEVFRKPGRSFLMPPTRTDLTPDITLDITHEALIRQWKRLAKWTANEAEQADLYLRLEAAARRHLQHKEALWIDPALQIALNWRDEHKPTNLWAQRYGGDFALAMDFLNRSRDAREVEHQDEQQRATDQARQQALAEADKRELILARKKEDSERHLRAKAEKQRKKAEQERNRAKLALALALFLLALTIFAFYWAFSEKNAADEARAKATTAADKALKDADVARKAGAAADDARNDAAREAKEAKKAQAALEVRIIHDDYRTTKDPTKALKALNKIITDLDPDSASAYAARGSVYADLATAGKPAYVDHRDWSQQDKVIASAELKTADQSDKNYSERALQDLDRSLSILPNQTEVLVTRAAVFQARGDLKKALDDYDATIRYASADPRLHFNRAALRASAQPPDLAGARDDYTKAIELLPTFGDAYLARAQLFKQDGKTKDAIADLKSARKYGDKSTKDAAEALLKKLDPTVPTIKQAVDVFIHYVSDSDRIAAEMVACALNPKYRPTTGGRAQCKQQGGARPRAAGASDLTFQVKKVELVLNGRTSGDVRYFVTDDQAKLKADERAATAIAKVVEETLAKAGYKVQIKKIPLDQKKWTLGRAGLIEVWIPSLSKAAPQIGIANELF